jgi:hypothetical protein
MKTKGGLLSFNNFLSTSLDREVSFAFAESNQDNRDMTGVLFEININPSVLSTSSARIYDISGYETEEEILFSMHSIFRIGEIKQLHGNSRLWQVELVLTISDNDSQLYELTKYISGEIRGSVGWDRLGQLMIKLGHFIKAENLYKILLNQTTSDDEKLHTYNMLGLAKCFLGEYRESITFYEKGLEIEKNSLPSNHLNLGAAYNNIGGACYSMGEYLKALSYYEKALEIWKETLPPNHPGLATFYNKIGNVYSTMGDYSKTLSYYKKST